jgi:CheY-like chemotaxis protein
MVYGFVKQSGGHVEVYSEVGVGTTVKVYLPRADAIATELPWPTADASPPAADGRATILVVEDNALVRASVVEQLRVLGYDVIEAASGRDALRKLEAQPVDLMFTDVVMPGGMTGFDLAEAAHARWPRLRILFTSGYAEEALRQRGQLTPGARLLSKPYPRAALAAAIRELLDAAD